MTSSARISGPRASRGYRNCNPGNIDWSPKNQWQGQTGREATGSPARFATFSSHAYGIRALAALLTTYQDRHALRTIRTIINRWAPPSENKSVAYINHVAAMTGFEPDDALDLHKHDQLFPLVKAVISHELGGNPYSDAEIDGGLELAGVVRPVVTVAGAVTTPAAKLAAGGGAVATALAVVAEVVPHIATLNGLPAAVLPWVLGGATVVAVAWIARDALRRGQAA